MEENTVVKKDNVEEENTDWRKMYNPRMFCVICGVLSLFVGIICSIVLASKLGISIDAELFWGEEPTRDWNLTYGIFFGGVFITAVISSVLFALAEILKKLDEYFLQNSYIDNINQMTKTINKIYECVSEVSNNNSNENEKQNDMLDKKESKDIAVISKEKESFDNEELLRLINLLVTREK